MTDAPETTYCHFHPDRETSLRCNRCERYICSKCAIPTPTGYRCKECVKGHQKHFDTAAWIDYPLGFGVAAILSFLGSLIVPSLGFFSLLLAPVAGTIIGEAARFAIRKRRGKRLFQVIAAGALIGSLPLLLRAIFFMIVSLMGGGGFGFLFDLIWRGIYTAMVTSTVYYQISGMIFRR